MSVPKLNAALITVKQVLCGFHWHAVVKWRFMEVERDLPESLCIPLEASPPYCNFLSEPYLEQPETALQPSLAMLLLITCCCFITVSISLCLFFILPFSLHLPISGRCRCTEKDPPTQSSVSHTISQPECHLTVL